MTIYANNIYIATHQFLFDYQGGEKIQAIDMGRDIFRVSNAQWHPEAFSKMRTLKFLRVRNMCIQDGPKHLPSNVIILDWTYYPSKSLPPSFEPSMLVQLRLQSSKIEGLGREVEVRVLLSLLIQICF